MRAVRDFGRPLIDDPTHTSGVVAVGVDETAFLAASAGSHTQFVTGIVAMPGPGRPRAQLLDVVPGRSGSVVQQWMQRRTRPGAGRSRRPPRPVPQGYATALRTSLPDAVRVLDAFHVVRLGQAVVDDVRRRRQQETLGRRGHREDPLYRGRRLLRRGFLTLNQRQWTRLELTLSVGDPSGQPTQAWMVAQQLQLLHARSHDLPDARRKLWAKLGPLRPLRRPRTPAAGTHARRLEGGAAGLLDSHRTTGREQRPVRGDQRPDQEGEADRTRLPELRQLPPAAAARVGLDWRTVHWQLHLPPRSEAAHHASWRRAAPPGLRDRRVQPPGPRVVPWPATARPTWLSTPSPRPYTAAADPS